MLKIKMGLDFLEVMRPDDKILAPHPVRIQHGMGDKTARVAEYIAIGGIKEVIVTKELPIEVIKEVFIDREVLKEIPKIEYITKIEEKQVPVEIIKEVIIDRPVEIVVEKEVEKKIFIDREVEVLKEVLVEKFKTPTGMKIALGISVVLNLVLLLWQ